MDKNIITEDKVKEILTQFLTEETSKVSRQDYARVLFKIEELQNSLNETIKEYKQLEHSIPSGLKTLTNGRMKSISIYLANIQQILSPLKERVVDHKKRASRLIVNKGADVSSFGNPSEWQRGNRDDREIG